MIPEMILIDHDPFSKESRLIHVKDGLRSFVGVSSDINDLAKEIIHYSQEFGQNKVRFHAPVTAFYELKRQLEEAEKDTYGENKIDLEIC